eukprot:4796223-Pleurochrysis_carterae.AAC.1
MHSAAIPRGERKAAMPSVREGGPEKGKSAFRKELQVQTLIVPKAATAEWPVEVVRKSRKEGRAVARHRLPRLARARSQKD